MEFVQTFIMLVEDAENSFQRACSYQLCQHMVPQHTCKQLAPRYNFPCPTSEDIKYRLTRASVDSVNLFLVEGGTALNVQVMEKVHSPHFEIRCPIFGTVSRIPVIPLALNSTVYFYVVQLHLQNFG